MKKVLGCLGVLSLCVCAGFVGLMVFSYTEGNERQEEFYQLLLSDDLDQFRELLHPSLQAEIDAPVLGALMRASKESLGEFERLRKRDFQTHVSSDERGKITKSKGTVLFSKGEVECELVYLENKVIFFDIDNDSVVERAFAEPEIIEFYKQRGRQFLQTCFDQKFEEAYAMLGEKMHEEVTYEQFDEMAREAVSMLGTCRSIVPHAEKDEMLKTGFLEIYYESEFEGGTTTSSVRFGFEGLKASIWGFYLTR